MKLVLFDIDGTLVYCGKVGRRSIEQAIKKVFRSNGIPSTYSLSGKTDRQIIYDILLSEDYCSEEIENRLDIVLDEYYSILKTNIKSNGLDKKIMPGILPLLESLSKMKNILALGLLTGNLKKSALLKLEVFNLHKYFFVNGELFGGFGSDHIERSKIAEIAVERARKNFSYDFKEKEIIIIGDTNHDITCGKHMNVKSIAVSTGEWLYEDLLNFQPDHLFHDFSDREKTIKAILE
jgi:phosphoglycolate phosphatase